MPYNVEGGRKPRVRQEPIEEIKEGFLEVILEPLAARYTSSKAGDGSEKSILAEGISHGDKGHVKTH